ncbi:MAG: hypothetical protein PHW72_03175 [Candidatus Pacebacteria bacterium]|nr:hypothetical protein [Candidatus Paceibacterota bacterium]
MTRILLIILSLAAILVAIIFGMNSKQEEVITSHKDDYSWLQSSSASDPTLDYFEKEIERLAKESSDKEMIVAEQRQVNKDLFQEVTNKDEVISEKDRIIAELLGEKQSAGNLSKELKSQEEVISEQKATIEELAKTIQDKEKMIVSQEKEIISTSQELKAAQQILGNAEATIGSQAQEITRLSALADKTGDSLVAAVSGPQILKTMNQGEMLQLLRTDFPKARIRGPERTQYQIVNVGEIRRFLTANGAESLSLGEDSDYIINLMGAFKQSGWSGIPVGVIKKTTSHPISFVVVAEEGGKVNFYSVSVSNDGISLIDAGGDVEFLVALY